ncbi:hypothetical protein SLE2022_244730 [Rubroshorea leprosula]
MENVKFPLLIILAVLFVLPEVKSELKFPLPPNDLLCTSQFAVANHACAFLPVVPLPTAAHLRSPPSQSPLPPSPHGGHNHGHRHGPPPDDGGHHIHEHHHRRRHGHRHGHVYRYKETTEEDNCCKWLKTIDNECVCAVLAHLPPFLSRPIHNYTVHVDDSCDISFLCAGGLKP